MKSKKFGANFILWSVKIETIHTFARNELQLHVSFKNMIKEYRRKSTQ